MRRMGSKEHGDRAPAPIDGRARRRSRPSASCGRGRGSLDYSYDRGAERTGISSLLRALAEEGIILRDIQTRQSSLEDISSAW